MAFTLSRIDRAVRTYQVSAEVVDEANASPPPLSGVDVALLPPRTSPTINTQWTAATYSNGQFTVTLAGPDADPTGALEVSASSDLWMRITDEPTVDAEFVERITLLNGGTAPTVPAGETALTQAGADQRYARVESMTAALAERPTQIAGDARWVRDSELAAQTAGHVNDGSALDVALRAALVPRSEVGKSVQRRGASAPGAIVLTMDDAYIAMDQVRQWLDERGQRGTFCVTPGLMTTGTAGTKITDAHILAMRDNGHEVAVHSQTHANYTSLTAAQRLTESTQAKTYLETLLGQTVSTFAYPFGTASGGRNATTDAELYTQFERIIDTSLNTQSSIYPRTLPPPSLIRRVTWDDTNQAQILQMIRQAAVTPVIGCLFFHDLGTAVNPTSANVLEALDLAVSLGVPLITVSEAFGGFRTLGNPSFENSATDVFPWRRFTAGADGAVAVVTVTPDAGISGTRAVRLTAGPGTNFGYVRQTHPVIPGRTYTLSFRAKVASGTVVQANDAFGRITGLDYGQTSLNDTVTTGAPTSTSWTKFSVDYTAPQTAAFVNVDVVATDIATPTAVDFDHVWFGPKNYGDLG